MTEDVIRRAAEEAVRQIAEKVDRMIMGRVHARLMARLNWEPQHRATYTLKREWHSQITWYESDIEVLNKYKKG